MAIRPNFEMHLRYSELQPIRKLTSHAERPNFLAITNEARRNEEKLVEALRRTWEELKPITWLDKLMAVNIPNMFRATHGCSDLGLQPQFVGDSCRSRRENRTLVHRAN
jgi:hypothetical protein